MRTVTANQLRVGHVIVEGEPNTHQKFVPVKVVNPPCSRTKVHVNDDSCYDAGAMLQVLGEV